LTWNTFFKDYSYSIRLWRATWDAEALCRRRSTAAEDAVPSRACSMPCSLPLRALESRSGSLQLWASSWSRLRAAGRLTGGACSQATF
jgi:hypothetical protein